MKQFHNIEAEQSILGTLLANNAAIYALTDLRAEHFYEETNRALFSAISEGINNGDMVSPITLKDRFDAKYLVSLLSHSVLDLKTLAKNLIDLAVSRRLQQAATDVLYGEMDGTEAMGVFSAALLDAGQSTLSARLKTGKQVALEIIDELSQDVPVYSCGLTRLDHAMGGGLHAKRLYAFPAQSGAGKTLLVSTISNHLKNNDVAHLYICAEMGERQTHQRSLSKDMRADSRAFYDKKHRGENFWSELGTAALNEKECLVYYDDPFLTFERLQQVIYAAVVQHKIKGFILDYWQLVRGQQRGQNQSDFLGEVAQWLASACIRYNLFGIVTAQLNRDGEILGSGGLKRAADQVYNIVRPDEFEPFAHLQNEKSRYTMRMSVGDENNPALKINEIGGYFEQV